MGDLLLAVTRNESSTTSHVLCGDVDENTILLGRLVEHVFSAFYTGTAEDMTAHFDRLIEHVAWHARYAQSMRLAGELITTWGPVDE